MLSNQQSTEPAHELVVEYCLAHESKFRSASCHYALRIAQALQLFRVVLAVAMQLASIRDVFGGGRQKRGGKKTAFPVSKSQTAYEQKSNQRQIRLPRSYTVLAEWKIFLDVIG